MTSLPVSGADSDADIVEVEFSLFARFLPVATSVGEIDYGSKSLQCVANQEQDKTGRDSQSGEAGKEAGKVEETTFAG